MNNTPASTGGSGAPAGGPPGLGLGPSSGALSSNSQVSTPNGLAPRRGSIRGPAKVAQGKKGAGKIGGKELAYPSKFLKGKGKATSKLKGSLGKKAKQLLKKKKK